MEVEDALVGHPDVHTCAAFSAVHDVLQEVVGIVLVIVPGKPCLDLPSLHEYLGERLAAPKWPQYLVFMDGLPKSHTNKLLRVKLGSRMGLPELSDAMRPVERTFEAKCPPQGTPLGEPIQSARVAVSASAVGKALAAKLVKTKDQQLVVVHHPSRPRTLVCHVLNIDRVEAIEGAREILDRYTVPSHFVESEHRIKNSKKVLAPPKTADATASILQSILSTGSANPIVQGVQELFTEVLDLDSAPASHANFFHLGGSSMLASQLASKVRKTFGVACSGAEVFHHATPNEMAQLVRNRSEDSGMTAASSIFSDDDLCSDDNSISHFSTTSGDDLSSRSSIFASLFQLVPIFLVFPIWQVTRYMLFFSLLLESFQIIQGDRSIGSFVIAYLVFHLCWVTIAPLVFVAIKWIVIGRYKPGRYPIWGSYYLRWWFVDICRKLFLRGAWGSSATLPNFYYRLLGAKIGKGARISVEADIAEFDLVTVGANAAVESATLRGFGVDKGSMLLGPVSVGNDASLGAKSVVAPHTSVPDGSNLGPTTSSYDTGNALADKHARVNRMCLPDPHLCVQMCFGAPLVFVVNFFSQIPPLLVLLRMLQYKEHHGEVFSNLNDLIEWLCDPRRIPFFLGIRLARAIMSPFFYMGTAIVVKKLVIGRFEAGPRDARSQSELLRHWLSTTLFTREKLQDVTDIIGRHYELVSILYRMLGAKVGKRVFWPGHQPLFSGEFDLLEVGDDVVFGSRSAIFCSTVDAYKKVVLCAGSNVSDNCVVLPGSIVGKNAVLGSNSTCPEGWYLPEGSLWFGSKGCEPECLERGPEGDFDRIPSLSSEVKTEKLQLVGDDSTLRPFGKAFYGTRADATYFVWPLGWIVFVTVVVKSMITTFHTLPLVGALHAAAAVLYGFSIADRDYQETQYPLHIVYLSVLLAFVCTHMVRVALWLAVELTAKWRLMGRRKVGRYNYDTSPYAQRWEIYQTIAKIRKVNRMNLLDFLSGTPFMAAYFRWNGGKIGKDCCLYPAGADPFMPEPDLVNMGDRCVVDCASIVCHLNTRGNFELAMIDMENDCTLRTRSRLQQGVYMEQGSQLLEKSLAMTGEVIEANSVWQGAPASLLFQHPGQGSSRKTRLGTDIV